MPTRDSFPEWPQQLVGGTEQSMVSYVRKPGYYAVHDRQPGTPEPGAVALFNDGAIAIVQGEPDQTEATTSPTTIGPVYGLQPSGQLAVPTGSIFVRFTEETTAASHIKQINHAGYEVVESPPYAPHTAWLRARSGNMADALANIPALEQVPNVVHIAPQMLMERSRRS